MEQKHFILVHGACHGAWTWFKLKPLLDSSGHRVTVLDLAASGIDFKEIENIRTFQQYTTPLLEFMSSIPEDEKVVLVGHSLGGINLALAMEKFPQKVSCAVFLSAFMPDTRNQPSFLLEKYCQMKPKEDWLDTQFVSHTKTDQQPHSSMLFGPRFLSSKVYQLSPIQDLELAKTLVRPSSLFMEDLAKAEKFSIERYGSIKRVYVVFKGDLTIQEEFQRWIIESSGVDEVMVLDDADHMAMLSKPQELCTCLLRIAEKCA